MKAFALSTEQIAAIVGALVADELGWRFRRHIDSFTIASLSPETALGEGGLQLDAEERRASARRAATFFGADTDLLDVNADRLSDWASTLQQQISERLVEFFFVAAGRDSEIGVTRHPADAIFADAAAAANLVYGRRRIISLVAPHGLLGFVLTVLTPNLQQIPRIDARGRAPEEIAELLAFGDALIATPSVWRFLINEGLSAPDNTMGLYFGEKMPADLAAAMRKAGFGAQREIYGSTETGLIGWRDSPGEPFRLFDGVTREDDDFRRQDPAGGDRTIASMDIIKWESPRSFRLGGRRDGALQIGGVNVFPEKIAAAVAAHERIDTCWVSVTGQTDGMAQLVAHIVLTNGQTPDERLARAVDQFCRETLRPHERPRIYRYEREAPTSATDAGAR
ncbi:MAG: hypothetical protein AAF224_00880 [Pseudomonadota bacterium]